MALETLHPMVIHFPIALLLTAFLFETVALVCRVPALHRIAFWNLILGMWGTLAAVITGGMATLSVRVSGPSRSVLWAHELLGCVAFALAAVAGSWHLAVGSAMPRPARWMAWGVLGLACAVMSVAGYLGGRLVYEFNLVGP